MKASIAATTNYESIETLPVTATVNKITGTVNLVKDPSDLAALSDGDFYVEYDTDTFTFDGSKKTPTGTLKIKGNSTFSETMTSTDSEVTVGDYQTTFTGSSVDQTTPVSLDFSITKASVAATDVTTQAEVDALSDGDYYVMWENLTPTFTGEELVPTATLYRKGYTDFVGEALTVSGGKVNVGTGYVATATSANVDFTSGGTHTFDIQTKENVTATSVATKEDGEALASGSYYIVWDKDTYGFDGEYHLPNGTMYIAGNSTFSESVTANGKGLNVGSYTATATSANVTFASGNTWGFTITKTDQNVTVISDPAQIDALSDGDYYITYDATTFEFDATTHCPTGTLHIKGNTDFAETVTTSGGKILAGEYTATSTSSNINFTSGDKVDFSITKKDYVITQVTDPSEAASLNDGDFYLVWDSNDFTYEYDGTAKAPTGTIYRKGTAYTDYSEQVTVSKAETAVGIYTGTIVNSSITNTGVNTCDFTIYNKTPEAGVDYVNESLTGLVPSVTYTINGTTYTSDASGKISLPEALLGQDISIVRKGETTATDSKAQTLSVTGRPATPDAVSKDEISGDQTSLVIGTEADKEYMLLDKDGNPISSWTSPETGKNSISYTGLDAGTYYQVVERVKATTTAPCSLVSAKTTVATAPEEVETKDVDVYNDKIVIDNTNSDYEYILTDKDGNEIPGKTWTSPTDGKVTFTGLTKGTGYVVKVRVKGDPDQSIDPGLTSTGLLIKTYANTYYTVTVDLGGQGTNYTISTFENSTVKVLSTPTPTNTALTFGGWYKDSSYSVAWNFETDTVTSNITIYAKWIENYNSVTFHYGNGITDYVYTNVADGTTISLPPSETVSGMGFVGWYKDSGLTQAWDFSTDTVTSNITLYAKWSSKTFTVNFDSMGGSGVAGQSVIYGNKASKPTNPTLEGYTFIGWYVDSAFSSKFSFDTSITSSITLYARFAKNVESIVGTVVDSDGNPINDAIVTVYCGGSIYGTTSAGVNGDFDVSNMPAGNYNVQVTYVDKDGNQVTVAETVTIDGNPTTSEAMSIIMPIHPTSTNIEVDPSIADVVIDGVNSIYNDSNIYNEEDQFIVNNGDGSIDLTIVLSPATTSSEVDEKAAEEKKVTSDTYQITIKKTVTKKGEDSTTTYYTETSAMLTVKIPLKANQTNKEGYIIYKYNNGVLTMITSTPNADGEYLEINANGELEIHMKGANYISVAYDDSYNYFWVILDSILLALLVVEAVLLVIYRTKKADKEEEKKNNKPVKANSFALPLIGIYSIMVWPVIGPIICGIIVALMIIIPITLKLLGKKFNWFKKHKKASKPIEEDTSKTLDKTEPEQVKPVVAASTIEEPKKDIVESTKEEASNTNKEVLKPINRHPAIYNNSETNKGIVAPIVLGGESYTQYSKSFRAKVALGDDFTREAYFELKNHLLTYKDVHSRISWANDSYRCHSKLLTKFVISGKTLSIYLALDPKDYQNTKYFYKDAGDHKKYQEVPLRIKIKSNRGIKYAKELIDEEMKKLGISVNSKTTSTDYAKEYPINTFDYLLSVGLIKELKLKQNTKPEEEKKEEVKAEDIKEEKTEEVNEVKPEEVIKAEPVEETSKKPKKTHSNNDKYTYRKGRKGAVSVGDLDKYYNQNDVVDLKSLKENGLITKFAKRYKLIAGGKITKSYTIYADEYTQEAEEMVNEVGGKVTLVRIKR